jgi:hypothetical protein
MQFAGIEIQALEKPGPLSEFADLARKAKQFEAWQDDIDGEHRRHGRVSRHFLAVNVTVILPANDIWYFPGIPLLSRQFSHPA